MVHLVQFEHLKIPLDDIKAATDNFVNDNCIGQGGFGKVYMGKIIHSAKGEVVAALKVLDPKFGQGDTEFWKEIMMLSYYSHENVVSLLGYCDDSGEKILAYEYASKRSLDLHLANKDLNWAQRLKICLGAARGLEYLHAPADIQLRVLHRDIKSSNILLDENWIAKISDFGLSKFGPANKHFTYLVSNAVGTFGYCDPLYVETGFLTKESDVYSFGVVLFEILCGRLCMDNKDKHQSFVGLARESYEKNKIDEIIFDSIKDDINTDSLKVFTEIAYQCLNRKREERPLMTQIVEALKTALKHQLYTNLVPNPVEARYEDHLNHRASVKNGNMSTWTTGLCGCFEDCSVCCLTSWCPCVAFGRIAEIVDAGTNSCFVSGGLLVCLCLAGSCHTLYSCTYRSRLRQLYMLPAEPCHDCCVHCCCLPCALCQEYRELKIRGIDPSLGWQGAAAVNLTAVNPPAGPGEMRR